MIRRSEGSAVLHEPPTDSHASPDVTPLRFVSAASLFDGHDAAINMIRRLLQAQGAEVVHLGHNRSVADIVRAAIQEDADGIAVSSYQGGHNEYFTYMVDMLREQGAEHIRVVVGGGGTIAPQEIQALESHGVEKIYTPEDGRRMGLVGMIADVIARVRAVPRPAYEFGPLNARDHGQLARSISVLEGAVGTEATVEQIRRAVALDDHLFILQRNIFQRKKHFPGRIRIGRAAVDADALRAQRRSGFGTPRRHQAVRKHFLEQRSQAEGIGGCKERARADAGLKDEQLRRLLPQRIHQRADGLRVEIG